MKRLKWMEYEPLIFSSHAIKQMFARKISKAEVKTVLLATVTQIYKPQTP